MWNKCAPGWVREAKLRVFAERKEMFYATLFCCGCAGDPFRRNLCVDADLPVRYQGLRVKAVLDRSYYETGVKISKEQMKKLNLLPHQQNPEWNYSLLPRSSQTKHVK